MASVLVSFFVVLAFLGKLPVQIPLFYSKPWGTEQLGSPTFLFVPLALSLVFTILNLVLSYFFYEYKLLPRLLVSSSCLVCILASITVLRIVFLVI